MADAITIKALQDASLDAKSLEEVVNGNAVTTVLSRLGETYPTLSNALNQIDSKLDSADAQVKQGITNLFENGGLPATPFKTKALMTASALVDGKYAMVTDDTVNNGLYVKTAGAWVKSDYDPLKQANVYTDKMGAATLSKHQLPSEALKIELGEFANGYYTVGGEFKESLIAKTTAPIAVTKGDCLVLLDMPTNELNASVISMFSSNGTFLYSLTSAIAQPVNTPASKFFDTKVGIFSSEGSYKNYTVIIPEDGFIRITKQGATYALEPALYKTTFNGLLDISQIQASKQSLVSFKNVLFSVAIDKDIFNNGAAAFNASQPLGAAVRYTANAKGVISKRIPVTKGQFIHTHGYTPSISTPRIVFEDAAGNYLGQQDIINENSISYEGTGHASFNVKSEFTGFFRVGSVGSNLIPLLVGVTDKKVEYHREYLKDNQIILFHENKSAATPEITNTDIQKTVISRFYNSSTSLNANYTVSLPYLLRKGEVLEYELKATSYITFALAHPKDTAVLGGTVADSKLALRLNATDIFDMEQGRAWVAAGKPNSSTYYANAKGSKVAYCNDEADTVIIFLRPTPKSDKFALYKQSEGYSVRIMSQEDYKLVRDAEIADRFTKIGKVTRADNTNSLAADVAYNLGGGSYPPVLLFKGEVLSYISNYKGGAVIENLKAVNMTNYYAATITDDLFGRFTSALAQSGEAANMPISLTNPNSFRYAQIYAKETCIVTANINVYSFNASAPLDVNGVIANKQYPARVINVKDIKIGENIKTADYGHTTAYLGWHSELEDYRLVSLIEGRAEVKASFSAANSYVEGEWWGDRNDAGLLSANVDIPATEVALFRGLTNIDSSGTYKIVSGQSANYKIATKLDTNSLVIVTSKTERRTPFSNESKVNPLLPIMVDTFKTSLNTVSKDVYINNYKVTSDTRVSIPITSGLTFNFCDPNGISLDEDIWSRLQIIQNGEVIVVLNTKTANQGQTSALFARKNVDVGFYNDKYKKVKIQFGEYIEEDKIVLKSYLETDKGHFKDVTTCDLWHGLRTAEPYPQGSVVALSAFENLTYPENQKARGTPFGFPVELHRGGSFNSLATVRNKKSNSNYAMQSDNMQQILMEIDWKINGTVNWETVDARFFEIRNPKIPSYNPGDTTLPAGYEAVQAGVERILSWMQGVINGTIILETTYQDYIDLNSFLDYMLAVMVSGNRDSLSNNFLLGSYDNGSTWHIFMYDADVGWGGMAKGVEFPTSWVIASGIFKNIYSSLRAELEARYAFHRRNGTIDIRAIQDRMMQLGNSHHSDSKILDAKYWGENYRTSGLPYCMDWAYRRIAVLDASYNYIA